MRDVEISQKGQVCGDIRAFSETKGIPLFYSTLPSLSGELTDIWEQLRI
jgi:hypothetical protein